MKKKIVIVGSTGNFGNFIFKELKKNNLVLGIGKKNDKDNYQCTDLSISETNLKTFMLIKEKFLNLDAIIICTGRSKKQLIKNSETKFLESFKSNFLTVSNTIDSYLKVYKKKPVKIIVISSIAGLKVIEAPIEYSVSKSALNHYCKIMAKKLSKFKINLNIISPGNILNKNNNWYLKKKINNKKIQTYIKKNVPLNSFCKPEQLVELCKLLIGNHGNFFQGSNIVIDGGQIL